MFKIFFLNFLIINLLFSLDFPSYVAEKEFLIENFNSIERWVFPKDINFELIKDKKDKFLKINYKFKEKHQELEIIYNFLYPGFDGERIGFKFKGDGSKNKIYVWGAYQNHWYPFTFFELKKEWQKIEIAPSPFYFFYKPVTKIKFVLKNLEKKENQGEFLIGKIYLITPEIFFSKLQPL
ncbi:MAG: hypothetical protein NZ891_04795, partial [bacterium]|nr:hypothetical protein [bacterium]MDW8164042.1 hypothetical protein [Candidatus Omnitrophota bacterium]